MGVGRRPEPRNLILQHQLLHARRCSHYSRAGWEPLAKTETAVRTKSLLVEPFSGTALGDEDYCPWFGVRAEDTESESGDRWSLS